MAAADLSSAAAVALPLEGHDLQLNVALIAGVANADTVRASLIRGDLEPECALVAARVVAPSLLPLHLAAHRAATLASRGLLRARTAHAELVHGLSGSKHVEFIGESLKRFGIADDTTDVVVALFGPKGADPEQAVAAACALLEGRRAPLAELSSFFDAALAAKYYHVVPAELGVGSLDEAIACRVGGMECL